MHTLIAFSQAGTASLEAIAGIDDQHVKVSGDDITVPKWNKIIATYFGGYAPGDGYLISPSIRRIGRIYLAPMDYVMSSYQRPYSINWFGDRGVTLMEGEHLNALCQGAVATDWYTTVGVWLADKIEPLPAGEIYTIKASVTGKSFTRGAWVTTGALTWTPDLPVGRYAIVGARVYTLYHSLFRFVFLDAPNRPGGKSIAEDVLCTDQIQRKGGMGVWGFFTQDQEPTMEILNMYTTAPTEMYARIDVIKVA